MRQQSTRRRFTQHGAIGAARTPRSEKHGHAEALSQGLDVGEWSAIGDGQISMMLVNKGKRLAIGIVLRQLVALRSVNNRQARCAELPLLSSLKLMLLM